MQLKLAYKKFEKVLVLLRISRNKVEMKPKTPENSERETRLVEGLRDHPELMERFEAILGLTQSGDGVLRTADEIEELLVEEVRRLGNTTMHQWAKTAEQAAVAGLRDKHPKIYCVKKKNSDGGACSAKSK